jgi:hypothetical protein
VREGFGIEQGRGEWVAHDKSRGTMTKNHRILSSYDTYYIQRREECNAFLMCA